MANKKWSSALSESASCAAPGELLEVVLELKGVELKKKTASPAAPGATRAQKMQLGKQNFSKASQPIKEKILKLGGEVLEEAWLNSTISAKLSKQALAELDHEEIVESIDLPRALKRE